MDTYFDFCLGFLSEIFPSNMVLFISSCWIFIKNDLFSLLRILTLNVFRYYDKDKDDDFEKDKELKYSNDTFEKERELNSCSALWKLDQIEADHFEFRPETQFRHIDYSSGERGRDDSPFCNFRFQFIDYESMKRNMNCGEENTASRENRTRTSISEYRFLSGKDIVGFMKQPDVQNFNVQELFLNTSEEEIMIVDPVKTEESMSEGLKIFDCNLNSLEHRNREISDSGTPKTIDRDDDILSHERQVEDMNNERCMTENQFRGGKDEILVQSEEKLQNLCASEPTIKDTMISVLSYANQTEIPKGFDEFTSETRLFESDYVQREVIETEKDIGKSEENQLLDETVETFPLLFQITNTDNEEHFEQDFNNLLDDFDTELELNEQRHETDETLLQDFCHSETESWDSEDSDELESLWEHQDLVEQLRMDLGKLPTIFEESEFTKITDELQPWKIEEMPLNSGKTNELFILYKHYSEKMRNFDILNYEKMYAVAIGLLHLKDPKNFKPVMKFSSPYLKCLSLSNILPCKRGKCEEDSSEKFLMDIHADLEVIYVGQTCLSWEILQWEYFKSLDLQESVKYQSRRYNRVAEEFQRFQILLQRFLENEAFQESRIRSYVKHRYHLTNLLQVPLIKEDPVKERKEKIGQDGITCTMLTEIIDESIRIFWEFLKADKKEIRSLLTSILGSCGELQDPSDSDLFMEIRADYLKKEKKIKDELRSGQCIVKKFQKKDEEEPCRDVVFSQIDLKLVSRVLRMSRLTTDQLVWCQKKLSKLTFVDRKVHREPSISLFPC